MLIANGKGLRVQRSGAVHEVQPRAERRVVPDQQPMVRRNRRDATAVNQTPCHELRKFLLLSGRLQSGWQISAGESLVQISQRAHKMFHVALHQLGQSAPVVRPDLLRLQNLAQRADGPRRLRASAAISVAAHAERMDSRRQAIAGARRQRECHLAVAC